MSIDIPTPHPVPPTGTPETGPQGRFTIWRISSHSGAEGNCVQVAFADPVPAAGEAVAVRDSQHPGGGHLAFTRGQWTAFLAAAKAGHLDRP